MIASAVSCRRNFQVTWKAARGNEAEVRALILVAIAGRVFKADETRMFEHPIEIGPGRQGLGRQGDRQIGGGRHRRANRAGHLPAVQ